jgi:hypothetical protein
MEINEYIRNIKALNACSEAVEDAHNYKTSDELWSACKRGDWMLWLIGKLSGEAGSEKRKQLVLTACKCARLALQYVPKNELRPLKAIETAEQWARGENNIILNDVRDFAVADAFAAAAKDAAAFAAAVADADAAAAAAAAYAAAYAAADAAADAAKTKVLAQCANIVRADYPNVDDLWKGE